METPASLLDMPEGVLLHTVSMLGKTTDVMQSRETCKALRDVLGADAWIALVKLRWGTVIDRSVSLKMSIRAFAAANSPRVGASDIDGAWTDDRRYWSRRRMSGTSGGHRALVLEDVWWFALRASFKVSLRAAHPCLACQRTLAR